MSDPEILDVVVIGSGISGIDAAYRIQTMCPGRSYAVLEARADLGGTWDLFRYPGIRSDSDMYTLGFPFEPWVEEQAIADGSSILAYLRRTAATHGIDQRIRYEHKVISASWDSADALWTLDVRTPDGDRQIRSRWVHGATGYYSYDAGYTPDYPGAEDFAGTLVHPQSWPEDLDVSGSRVVVVGSGATAVTLVPALVERGAAGVTMLQRSPSYLLALPARNALATTLRRRIGPHAAYRVVRAMSVLNQTALVAASHRAPKTVGRLISRGAMKAAGAAGADPRDFTPRYRPWDQRMCFVPDGDLFRVIRAGCAEIVTDTIDSFVPEGIRTSSGQVLPADVVVSATGLQLVALGGIPLTVDGSGVEVADHFAYRGVMLDGVPNLTMSVGYSVASWTLRADLAAKYACRLINELAASGARSVRPRAPAGMPRRPVMDLTSGYVQRALPHLPSQGDASPWRVTQRYLRDRREMRRADLRQDMVFGKDEPAA